MRNVAFLVPLVLGLGFVVQGAIFDRPCPTNIEAQQHFSVENYVGKWYEMQRYDSDSVRNYDCVQVRYALNDDQSIAISNMAHNLVSGATMNAFGRAVLSFPGEEIIRGMMNMSFFGAPNDRSNYWVLDTDYQSYSIVWSCEELEQQNQSEESFWILSRTPTLTTDPDALLRIHYIVRQHIDRSQVRDTEQLDDRCPVF